MYQLATVMLAQYEMSLLFKMCKTYTFKVFYFCIRMHRKWKSALNVQLLEQHPKWMNHCHALSPCLVLWPRGLRFLVASQTTCMVLRYVYSSQVGHSIVKDHTVPASLWSKSLSSGTPWPCRRRHWSFRMSHPWRLEPQDHCRKTSNLMCMCPGVAGSAFTYWEDPDLSL